MTQIQIDWSRQVETKRHNIATEKQAAAELDETHRHNVTTEDETHRHNVTGENETHRHNVRSEKQEDKRIKQEAQKIGETKRHNRKTEKQEDKRINLQSQKVSSEVKNLNAKTVAQELANAADQSDPVLYKTNRFINVFKSNAPAAWMYYGLDTLTDSEKKTVNSEASKTNPNNNKLINIIDRANKRKTGHSLSKEDRENWERFFNFGSGQGWRTNYEVEHGTKSNNKTRNTKAKSNSKAKGKVPMPIMS